MTRKWHAMTRIFGLVFLKFLTFPKVRIEALWLLCAAPDLRQCWSLTVKIQQAPSLQISAADLRQCWSLTVKIQQAPSLQISAADLRQCWSLTVKIQLPMAGPRMTQGNWLRLVTTYDYSNYQFVCFSNLTQSFWNVGVTSRCIHHSQDPRQTGIIPD